MRRIRWIAGSVLTAEDLEVERNELAWRQRDHNDVAHGALPGPPTVVGAHVRAVDGTVGLSMPHIAALSAPETADQAMAAERKLTLHGRNVEVGAKSNLRGWAVFAGREILSLGWGAGGKVVARLCGALASRSLACTAVEFAQPIAEPDSPQPFRLYRRSANPKEKRPEALVIELAAAADPKVAKTKPPPGLQVGGMVPQGFVPLLEVRPGRGVIIRGKFDPPRTIFRKPPADGSSDEALVAAFLRSDAGQAARTKIEEQKKKIGLDIKRPVIATNDARGKQVRFTWSVTNETTMKLKCLRALTALMPLNATISPAWTAQDPPEVDNKVATTLQVGQTAVGEAVVLVPSDAKETDIGLMLAVQADYGVPLTQLKTTGIP